MALRLKTLNFFRIEQKQSDVLEKVRGFGPGGESGCAIGAAVRLRFGVAVKTMAVRAEGGDKLEGLSALGTRVLLGVGMRVPVALERGATRERFSALLAHEGALMRVAAPLVHRHVAFVCEAARAEAARVRLGVLVFGAHVRRQAAALAERGVAVLAAVGVSARVRVRVQTQLVGAAQLLAALAAHERGQAAL